MVEYSLFETEDDKKISKDWRELARILTIQSLTQLDVQGDDFLSDLDEFITETSAPPTSKDLARQLTKLTWENRKSCDELIARTVKHWQLSRITLTDRAILRLAIAEMLYRPDVPMKVVIDQAIELAKKFSTAESPQFINGVLDAIAKEIRKSPLKINIQTKNSK